MLKVLARGATLVPVMHAPVRRFVGRAPGDVVDGVQKWVPCSSPAEPTELPEMAEYVAEVKAGALWAADEATAKRCGVQFDSKFGGEFSPPAPASAARKAE